MSLSTTYSGPAPRERTETRVVLVIIWSATVVSYLLMGLNGGHGLSTDDAMRLVQVRDLLAGQSWFDLTQYRLNPPGGVASHWSRLIDLPLAALIRGGEVFLSAARAEQIATLVWPASLLLILLGGTARLARELAGDAAARLALIFAALMAPVLQHFRPGAIDHHNAQIVLLIWSLVLAMQPRRRDAVLAGVACALSIAIGEELAPAVAAIAALVGVRWIVQGDDVRRPTMAFALAFAAALFVLFAATIAPSAYAASTCDAFSIVQVTAIGIGGGGLALLTAIRALNSPIRRLAGAVALAAVIAATMALAFPACLGDPYGNLDPRLATLWLDHVSEARSVFAMLRDLPQEVLPYYGLIVVGLAAGVFRSWRDRDESRWIWIVCTTVLAVLGALALWEVRSAAGANAVAVVVVAAAVVRGFVTRRAVFFGLGRGAMLAAVVVNPLSLIALGQAAARALDGSAGNERPPIIADGPGTCRRATDYGPLTRLPRGLIVAFIDAGPFILMETPHAALAAPYHRNLKGNAAMFDVFLSPPKEAAARLATLGADYLAFCPGSPERYTYAGVAPDGLAAALGRGDVPEFLDRIALEGTDLVVYRVKR